MGMSNFSIITEFLLMEFSSVRELQVFHAVVFLMIYLAALMGNLLTIAAIITDSHLHSPMYFFLSNLSFLDICTISVTLPKFIVNSLSGIHSLSVIGCAIQIFFLAFFASAEFALLVVMSYDRFMAICHPLHYGIIMNPARCLWAASGSWLSGLIHSAAHIGNMFRQPFRGSNVIHQFFCDGTHVFKVLTSDVFHIEFLLAVASLSVFLFCFAFLIASYARIFSTALKIPSVEGRYKAVSTCSPQLIILLLFILSVVLTVLTDKSDTSPVQNLLIALSYTALSPLMNPIIYSLRNRKITVATVDYPVPFTLAYFQKFIVFAGGCQLTGQGHGHVAEHVLLVQPLDVCLDRLHHIII
ncbi:olfactory receptor 14I1-like [Macrotis lagotis]|uniref:olfactory receptor 14I1-like n=1 Tax=Macrotis lagotis TaxID=92651 RepID=UPI003D69393C